MRAGLQLDPIGQFHLTGLFRRRNLFITAKLRKRRGRVLPVTIRKQVQSQPRIAAAAVHKIRSGIAQADYPTDFLAVRQGLIYGNVVQDRVRDIDDMFLSGKRIRLVNLAVLAIG